MIVEKHLCRQCKLFNAIPTDEFYKSWDISCNEKHEKFNPTGGLTTCEHFKSKR